MTLTLIVSALLIGTIPGLIARRKGYGFVPWWLFGAALFIVALPLAIFEPKNPARYQQCPACREWIDASAVACPHCGRDVPARTLPVGSQPPANWPVDQPRQSQGNWPFYAFAVGCVALALGVTLWAAMA